MATDPSWAAATNRRAGIPYERDVIAELDAENVRLHGELIDVQCELATARVQLTQLAALARPVAERRCCAPARSGALIARLQEWGL